MTLDWLHLGTLILAIHVLGIIAACHAILNTRTSQGAIAWAVSLAAMPYLTLIPYLFLGRSKFSGYVDARRHETEALRTHTPRAPWLDADATDGPAGDALGRSAVLALTRLGGMPFVGGNAVRTLVNGDATFSAILSAIDAARDYVIVQFFIVRDDALGQMLRDALLARAAAGVRCYLLYDSIGSFDLPHSYVDTLRRGGVEVHPFATNRKFVNRFQLNFRNHRKIVVVDGNRAFVGGHNVGVEYLGAKPRLSPWRDTHIEIRGPVVASIQYVFAEDWHWATQNLPPLAPPPAALPGDGMHCLAVPMGPADKQETGSLFFVEAINAARERVWITTPYLVPDEAVIAALKLAVMRGVDVRILIPSRRDHYVVFEASKLYARDLVEAGVKVFRYRPGFLHQKVVLVDRIAAAIGSANLDNRSFRLNFEIMVLTVDRAFAGEVEAMLDADFAQAYEVDMNEYRQSPAWRRIAMHVARLFAPIL
ncbi:cardiolipin synthase [Burkholderia pseudomultivorans]|uniref:Cardiolipin synthase A n=1 Tax=Burkholderia pseudomultivorans TaxID=1207504 RepID=A0ABU2DXF6_9BURK|nr:cardiolipin synthase [Burkholderia pseudomultivorans]MDR8731886.1 Major cardiolipin synthase ClsA [Burkholderia pseudomultivorans]MDR8733776.1 Major cardiolipin synthase ClsA [Burkholderia pseudomultivorans]MDR8745567.1 Major cardiolipin synthase ClsA [Burkholderia pseudomultivorans]MDR8752270.1 Major cardiolipin synthase ClsA [Burkholderia pseudomultivorans]MDR8778250.1 Major cardiolipin synthase ClsA [Burkholderia pseudomultivorans]